MTTHGTLRLLGTSGSAGVPIIGCYCDVCTSSNPHNRRQRSAALLNISGKNILIDAGPDVRMQALRWEINTLDGVLFTHAHQDHTAGIDDLRIYYIRSQTSLPVLLSQATLDDIKTRFSYLFNANLNTRLEFSALPNDRGSVLFQGIRVGYFTFQQLNMPVNGFRFGDLAYVSDIRDYPETIFDDLKGVKNLVISALRHTPSPMHLTVDEAIAFSERVGAQHTYLTHLSHDLDHDKTNAYLPQKVRMGYDGLVIDFHAE